MEICWKHHRQMTNGYCDECGGKPLRQIAEQHAVRNVIKNMYLI